jgi:hypothetical protein
MGFQGSWNFSPIFDQNYSQNNSNIDIINVWVFRVLGIYTACNYFDAVVNASILIFFSLCGFSDILKIRNTTCQFPVCLNKGKT